MPPFSSLTGIILQYQSVLWCLGLIFALQFNGMLPWAMASSMTFVLVIGMAVLWRAPLEPFPVRPRGALFWLLLLFWGWLGLTTLWNPVPYLGVMGFWWVGASVLIFLTLTLQGPETMARIWPGLWNLLSLVGAMVCMDALYDLYVRKLEPLGPFVYRNSLAAFLCMLLLPLLGMVGTRLRARRWGETIPWILLVWLMLHLVFTIHSMGVYAAMGAGLAILLLGGGRWLGWRAGWILMGVVLAGWGLHEGVNALASSGWNAPVEKASRLLNAVNAPDVVVDATWQQQNPRVLLLQSGWRMWQEMPWYGIGLGTFWLKWPPYRNSMEFSSGFYLHSDPLQLAIEAGMPAILLIGGVILALSVGFLRLWGRGGKVPGHEGIEAASLLAALSAIFLHACIDFDLYVLPAQFLIGIFMARFVWLSGARPVVLSVAQWSTPGRFRGFAALMMGIALAFMTMLGAADLLYGYGHRLAAEGDLRGADRALIWSTRLLPGQDNLWFSHASLFITLAGREQQAELRKSYYLVALEYIDTALKHNPFRWTTYFMRGEFLRHQTELSGPGGTVQAEEDFRHALRLNPRYVTARVRLADIMLEQGRMEELQSLLRDGLNYYYAPWLSPWDDIQAFYALVVAHVPDGDGAVSRELDRVAKLFVWTRVDRERGGVDFATPPSFDGVDPKGSLLGGKSPR